MKLKNFFGSFRTAEQIVFTVSSILTFDVDFFWTVYGILGLHWPFWNRVLFKTLLGSTLTAEQLLFIKLP